MQTSINIIAFMLFVIGSLAFGGSLYLATHNEVTPSELDALFGCMGLGLIVLLASGCLALSADSLDW